MGVTELPIVSDCNPIQLLNAPLLIEVTEFGIEKKQKRYRYYFILSIYIYNNK